MLYVSHVYPRTNRPRNCAAAGLCTRFASSTAMMTGRIRFLILNSYFLIAEAAIHQTRGKL